MRISEFIVYNKENLSDGVIDIEKIMYWVGRIIGWISLLAVGYVGGSIVRGLLKGFGII